MTIDVALTGEDWRTDNIPDPPSTPAAPTADDLIAAEIAKQDAMWGSENERADATKGQLLGAATAQVRATYNRETWGDTIGAVHPAEYPQDWSGFRDYGSTIANLVVAAAYLRQEIKRRLRNGEDYTRTSRSTPYRAETGLPNPVV